MSSNSPNNRDGFTILEVLIAIAILVFITFGISQTVTQAFKVREIVMNEGNFYNEIRLSMSILQRDVALIYSPVLSAPTKATARGPGGSGTQRGAAPDPNSDPEAALALDREALGRTTAYWLPPVDKGGLRPSRFVGTETKMSFVSLSGIRVYKNSAESEFLNVSYELKTEEKPEFQEGTQVLVKTASPNAFDDEDASKDKFKRNYPLLHGIKKLSFRYYRKDKDRWDREWDNDKSEWRNLYPDIIEIKVEVVGPSQLSHEGLYKIRPEIPLRGIDPSF